MSLVKILGHVLGDRYLAGFEHLQIARADLSGDFIRDVEQLSQVRIIPVALGIMSQSTGKLLGTPSLNFLFRWQLRAVDVNDGCIWRAEIVDLIERLTVDLLCHSKPITAGFGEPDQFFQPVCSSGLNVNPGASSRQRLSNRL